MPCMRHYSLKEACDEGICECRCAHGFLGHRGRFIRQLEPDGARRGRGNDKQVSVRTLDSVGTVGEEAHIAVDTAGHAAISCFNRMMGMIRCGRLIGSTRTLADVGNATGTYVTTGRNSIVLTANGSPVVFFHKADAAYYVASWTGATWTSPSAIGWTESAWAFLGGDGRYAYRIQPGHRDQRKRDGPHRLLR